MVWVRLIGVDRCAPGRGTFVGYGDLELAVFRLPPSDEIIVLENACPHASGNLSGGEIAGNEVSCPWHHWRFDLRTGVCTHSPVASVKRFRCEVRDGSVWAELPGR